VYRSWTKRTTLLLQKAIPDKWYSSTVEQLPLSGVEEHLKKHPLQPHQMSRAQYEADPQTMWRAEGSDTLGGSSTSWKSSGLHFGEHGAAKERGADLAKLHDTGEDPRPVRLFSLRTKGRFSNEPTASHPAAEVLPQTKGVAPDEDIGDSAWAQRSTGRWYRNDYEGYKLPTTTVGGTEYVNKVQRHIGRQSGVLSGYTPRRKGFMTTHSEEVLQAHDEGKSIHPTILQQAQIGPEYSETIDPPVADVAPPPPKLFQTLNPYAGKSEKIEIPTRGGGVIEHSIRHDHALHVTNEEYNEGMRKMKEGSSEPIWGHIGEPRPAGSPR